MKEAHLPSTDHSLAGIWAKRYVQNLRHSHKVATTSALSDREHTTKKLLGALRFASSQAWAKTEQLLHLEVDRHKINPDHIDPWKIAEDSRLLFQKACDSYHEQITPQRFSVVVTPECGRFRKFYTQNDPRILGFMSMQFHYTGQILLDQLTPLEKSIISDYLKVIDDNLYMPLQRSYEAAANLEFEAPELEAVRQLLPLSTRIAEYVCAEVAANNPQHRCYTGLLKDLPVRISSIRDVEMFQLYLCLCAMEGSMKAVQQELFPLCVMLYPPLNVPWNFVRQLVKALDQEIQVRLPIESVMVFSPYLKAFEQMFSSQVFAETNSRLGQYADVISLLDRLSS